VSFGPSYISGWGKVPARVARYLLPQEVQVITVRYHPVVLIWPVLAVLAACAAGSTVTVFTGIGGAALIAVWAVAVIASVLLAALVWVWLNRYLVLTRLRVIQVPGIFAHKMVSIPARDIRDIYLSRTLPGRLFGHGLLTLTLGREKDTLIVINHIPYPDQVYLEARSLYFGEALD
jgi:hypothetical protein